MKKLISYIAVLAAVITFAESDVQYYNGQKLKKMTPEEKAEWLARRASNVAIQNFPDCGKIIIVNAQKEIKDEYFKEPVDELSSRLRIPLAISTSEKTVTTSNASSFIAESNAKGGIFIISNVSLPMSIIAQEDKWGLVNIAALKKDNPADSVLRKRIIREIGRVFAFVFGATDAMFDGCVTEPVNSLADLDSLNSDTISPGLDERIIKHLRKMGMKPGRKTTYRRACMEGWAPAPTNKWQQAIWDKVHTVPKDPMKIEYDPKKGR